MLHVEFSLLFICIMNAKVACFYSELQITCVVLLLGAICMVPCCYENSHIIEFFVSFELQIQVCGVVYMLFIIFEFCKVNQ